MITAQEARNKQKESFTSRGKVIDSIVKAVKGNESETVVPNLNLTKELNRELENKGYYVNGNVISWYQIPVEEKVKMKESLKVVSLRNRVL